MKFTKLLLLLLILVPVFIHPAQADKKLMLIDAAQWGDLNQVTELLRDRSVNVNATGVDGRTALMWAARNGHEAIVKLLLERGANVNATDKFGDTALISAAMHDREAIVKLLLDHGANVNAANNYGNTALTYAADKHRKEIAQLLNIYIKEYLPFREKRIEELKGLRKKEVNKVLETQGVPNVLLNIVNEYAAGDFAPSDVLTFSQFLAMQETQKKSS